MYTFFSRTFQKLIYDNKMYFSNEDTYQFRNSIRSQELESFQDQSSRSNGYEGMAQYIYSRQIYKVVLGKG